MVELVVLNANTVYSTSFGISESEMNSVSVKMKSSPCSNVRHLRSLPDSSTTWFGRIGSPCRRSVFVKSRKPCRVRNLSYRPKKRRSIFHFITFKRTSGRERIQFDCIAFVNVGQDGYTMFTRPAVKLIEVSMQSCKTSTSRN
jgi:hypothetical protein